MRYTLALHGGAGTLLPEVITPAERKEFTQALDDALKTVLELLKKGSSAVETVVHTVAKLEDCPLFNAGRGSVFSHDGRHEMDAAVMNGADRKAGAVASVSGVKNPVILARTIMEHCPHVFLSGAGAEEFARLHEIDFESEKWFYTRHRYHQWQVAKADNALLLDHTPDDVKYGTVGAVALDVHGQLAAATSTGGLTNKKFGRIGDTPLIGCGTYADDLVAVSCTGWGEFFIRTVAAHQVAMRHRLGETLQSACHSVIDDIEVLGGDGGLIAVNVRGEISMPFNTPGMYRAAGGSHIESFVKIFNEKKP
ncbi:isoaspartyl peptidase/L-asparaginase family protein [Schleiferia thermophila]|uniref:isoaspartyl peptidase/L-asparaginase family protein n=1 Tax=Schleiferia thermophila TaxID=884107 RepID=UPI003EEDB5F6